MKDFYTLKEELAAVAETYSNLNEAFALTKANFIKVKSLEKMLNELVKFAKKAGHRPFMIPPGSGFKKRDVSTPNGFYSPVLMGLIQSLYYTVDLGPNTEWADKSEWSNKTAKTIPDKKFGGLEVRDPEDKLGQIAVIRAEIFIAMSDFFEANPEFMNQYGSPEEATKLFIK